MKRLTHINDDGQARMVDVGEKDETTRIAVARGHVTMQPETLRLIQQGSLAKGDVLSVARLAGIMGAKQTASLIPLCHSLNVTSVTVDLHLNTQQSQVEIEAQVTCVGRTGVEMEALTAVTVAGLTVYDMAKAVDRGMRISEVRLVSKRGGRSGDVVME
ncbi:MAG: cyclic pyranopterin monophosphate synthase MoaC [Anaerolineae bacterium]|nr:cyclic pyranopterin monophosphate synthase MoaC [Anaerolineae bacterium]